MDAKKGKVLLTYSSGNIATGSTSALLDFGDDAAASFPANAIITGLEFSLYGATNTTASATLMVAIGGTNVTTTATVSSTAINANTGVYVPIASRAFTVPITASNVTIQAETNAVVAGAVKVAIIYDVPTTAGTMVYTSA
jgi:hypothetical protein